MAPVDATQTSKIHMTRVSIVIPCYNLGEYLQEALDSALAQTHPDLEVLLIDDGSTDPATTTILDSLAPHPRLRVFRTTNQGVARARNFGIGQATGAYILPLDADDRILPEYVARAAAILDANPGVAFVGCHYRTFGLRQSEYRPAAYRLPDMLVENVAPVTSLFRRCVWEEVGGYCPELNSIEDWDLWIGMLERGYRGEVVPDILFEYRVRSNSNLSQIRQPELYQKRLQLLYARHAGLYEQYRAEVLALKDLLFAHQLAYTHWLEEQRCAWEQVAQERLEMIARYDRSLAVREQRRQWWRYQIGRVQRVLAQHPDPIHRMQALTKGGLRVLRRKLTPYLQRVSWRKVL
jgi:glycosyltransferase involved in cell wall biosynthesis